MAAEEEHVRRKWYMARVTPAGKSTKQREVREMQTVAMRAL